MPTLDDLHDTLGRRAALCDDTNALALLPVARTRPRRRVYAGLAAVAAAATVVSVGAVTLPGQDDNRASVGSVAYPPRAVSWLFTVHAIPGWRSERTLSGWESGDPDTALTAGWAQLANIYPVNSADPRHVVYNLVPADYPGPFTEGQPPHAESIIVDNRPGIFVPVGTLNDPGLIASIRDRPWRFASAEGGPELIWRNTDGSWNVLQGTVGFRPETLNYDNAAAKKILLRMAVRVTVSPTRDPVTAAFRADPGPSYRPVESIYARSVDCASWVKVGTRPPVYMHPLDPWIVVCRAPLNSGDGDLPRHRPGNGHTWFTAQRDMGDGTRLVVGAFDGVLQQSDADRILANADTSPKLDDQSTWLPIP